MALRGESIGTAYVRIIASGKDLDRSIAQAFREANVKERMQTEGEDASDHFWSGFNDENKKNKRTTNRSIFESIEVGAGRFEAKGAMVSRHLMDGIRRSLKDRFGEEIGERIATDIEHGLQTGLIEKSDLPRIFNNMGRLVNKALVDIKRDEDKWAADWQRTLDKTMNDSVKIIGKFNTEWDKTARLTRQLRDDMKDLDAVIKKDAIENLKKLTTEIGNYSKGVKDGHRDRDRMVSDLGRLYNGMRQLGFATDDDDKNMQRLARTLAFAFPKIDGFNRRVNTASDYMGKAFGRGSRNNFLNFIGSMVRGFVRLGTLPGKILGQIGGVVRTFTDSFSQAQEAGKGFFGSVIDGAISAGGAMAQSVVGWAALAGAIQLVIFLAGFAVSALSSLVGILAALASTIAFGVVGALAPLAGLIVPIGAAVGGVALAFAGLDKETKKDLTKNLKPLKQVFTDIGGQVRKGLFGNLDEQVKRLRGIFDSGPFKKFAKGIGEAISGIADSFLDVLESPALKAFGRAFAETIPKQLGDLGDIFANVFKGVAGIFRGLIPVTNEFLGWVGGLAESFADWANKAGSHKKIVDFFEKAANSAKSLGGFLESVWNFLKPILFGGQETGDSLFDKMAGSIQKAADFLDSKKGQKALKQWFADAKDVAVQIGHVVTKVVELIDELDTPENRKKVKDFFKTVADVIGWIADHWNLVEFFMKWLTPIGQLVVAFKAVRKAIGWVTDAVQWVWDKFKKAYNFIKDKLGDLRDKFNRLDEKVEDLGNTIKDGPGKAFGWMQKQFDKARKFIADKLGDLRDKLNDLADKVEDVGDKIKEKLGDAWKWVRDKFGDAVAWIRGKLNDLGGWFRDKFNDIKGRASDAWSTIRSKASDMVSAVRERLGDITDWFRDLPGKVRGYGEDLLSAGKDLGGKILSGIQSGLSGAISGAGNIASGIGGALETVINDAIDKLNSMLEFSVKIGPKTFSVDVPDIGHVSLAGGGIISGPTLAMVGEAGPEAVVPLNRPLSQIDPAVRELSRAAQSLSRAGVQPATSTLDQARRGVDVGGITIITPTEDPAAVATETVNRLVAATYF